jgi:hypothetical protein
VAEKRFTDAITVPRRRLSTITEMRRAVMPSETRDLLFDEALPPEKRRAILEALAEKAQAGDVRVAAFLFDRLYGRPAAAPAPRPGQSSDSERIDLRRLDDREMETFAGLFEKAAGLEREPDDPDGDGGAHTGLALSPGPGSVCEGGA